MAENSRSIVRSCAVRWVMLWGCWLAGGLLAAVPSVSIANFDGAKPLAGWSFSSDSEFPGTDGSLAIGPGHTGRGAVLEYRFACEDSTRCGGSVAAILTSAEPIAVKRRAAISLWIRAVPEVRISFLTKDKSGEMRRYPFEATTLEHPRGGDWQQIVIPLAAKSTGYGDEDHSGAPKSRMTAVGIQIEARYPQPMRGNVGFDDVRLLESSDQIFTLRTALPLAPAPPDSAHLRPRLGINIHTLGDQHMLDLVREAGFSFVRTDLLWRQVERNARYRFFAYDRLLTALEAHGMGALWILDYGHPLHGGDPPRSRDDVAAFARYGEAAAAHFKGRNVRYEVWNEPNTERFWQPHPNTSEYAALLREAVAAIHRADPAARVASGGLAKIDLPFLEETIAAGGESEVNAVGVHPYRRGGPETVAPELSLLRALLEHTMAQKVEIWDTEWGYASYDYFSKNLRGDGHSAPGRKRQAVLTCREVLTVWALGLPMAVWYELRDGGDDPTNPEHNYGLLDAKNADKPAMKAIRALARIADDHSYAGMVQEVPDGVHAMRLDGSANKIFVMWSEQPDARTKVRFPMEGFISVTNLMGEPLKPRNDGHGEAEIALVETDGPVYVEFTSQ